LRSLEFFWKNPHVQIPSKSLEQFLQVLPKFQIQLKFEINFSFESFVWFGLTGPALLVSTHPSPQVTASRAGPSGPCANSAPAEMCFPFWFALSKLVAFSLFSH
jgi:hypothetical protein